MHLDSPTLKIYMIDLWKSLIFGGWLKGADETQNRVCGVLVVLIPCSPVAWSDLRGRRYTWFPFNMDTFLFLLLLFQAWAVGYPWAMRLLP